MSEDNRDFFELTPKEKRKYWKIHRYPLAAFYIVLQYFVNNPDKKYTGYEIIRVTELKSGTVYPMLVRMESNNWLKSEEEEVEPTDPHPSRPPRIYYSLSKGGKRRGRNTALERFQHDTSESSGDMVPVPA